MSDNRGTGETEPPIPREPNQNNPLSGEQGKRLLKAFDEIAATPQQIGPYRIISSIGRGGMGEVYKAEQREPIHRTVALKVIKLGMDTREVVARFEGERQALALMDHPNIARVFDAGATDAGRPYFVMEYVAGEPIAEYCDKHQLTIRERLELFAEVCDAIQHAHQKGIIHRDLKPSNILVTVRDNKRVPKVIDFGVAKAISRQLTEQTLHTSVGQLIGTPEYMSPEQAEMTSLDVDTRSDVYSLGVVLYELLTGALPLDPQSYRRAGVGGIQRMIREVEPPRPSTRISSLGATAVHIAGRRQTQVQELTRQLRRELEWIPLKAMHKDRTHRYRTASEMADDISNYLNGRALLAGPESKLYLARKWAARNQLSLLATAAALVILIAGATAYIRGIQREQQRTAAALTEARKQKAEAEAQRTNAENREAESLAVLNFINSSVLGNATPESIPDKSTRDTIVSAMLDPAAKAVREEFRDQPHVQAAVMNQVALAYDKLGRLADAEPLYRDALASCRLVLGDDHPNTLSLANNYAGVLMQLGRSGDAEPLCRDTMLRRQRVLGKADPATLLSMDNYAQVLVTLGRNSEAEPLVREALEQQRLVLGEDHPGSIRSLARYASVLEELGRLSDAEPIAREALDRRKRVLGEDHPETLESLSRYSRQLRLLKRAAEAEPFARDAMERRRRVLGADAPHTIESIRNYALVLLELDRAPEAEPLMREALERSRRVQGPDHASAIASLHHYSSVLNALGRAADAEPLAREALGKVQTHPVLRKSPESARIYASKLAEILDALGRPDEANALRKQYSIPATGPVPGR